MCIYGYSAYSAVPSPFITFHFLTSFTFSSTGDFVGCSIFLFSIKACLNWISSRPKISDAARNAIEILADARERYLDATARECMR